MARADVIIEDGKPVSEDNLVLFDTQTNKQEDVLDNIILIDLQRPFFEEGKLVYEDPTILEKRDYCKEQMSKIPEEIRRLIKPEKYCVGGTEEYVRDKFGLIKRYNDRHVCKKEDDEDEC